MAADSILLAVVLVFAGVVCAVGIWALFEIARASRSVRTLAENVDARVVPLMEKADITIDAVNADLLRADAIVSRIEDITDRVDSTTRTVQEVANAPAEIVTDIADRVRRAWRRNRAEAAARHEQDAATEEPIDAESAEEFDRALVPESSTTVWPTTAASAAEDDVDTTSSN